MENQLCTDTRECGFCDGQQMICASADCINRKCFRNVIWPPGCPQPQHGLEGKMEPKPI